jgi:hypothetical protein
VKILKAAKTKMTEALDKSSKKDTDSGQSKKKAVSATRNMKENKGSSPKSHSTVPKSPKP